MEVEQKRAEILESIFGDTIFDERTGEVFIFCPNGCHDKKRKLQINVKKNTGHCWICSSNGGNIFYFLNKYANPKEKKDYFETIDFSTVSKQELDLEASPTSSIALPYSYEPLLKDSRSPFSRMAITYLKKEGIKEDSIFKFRIGICSSGEFSNRIIFPSYGEDGSLNFYTSRAIENTFLKYKNCNIESRKIVFNEMFINWKAPIVLVESAKTQYKHETMENIIPLVGSSLNEKHRLFYSIVVNSCPMVYICLDPGEDIKSLNLSKRLNSYGIKNKICVLSDQPDKLRTDQFKKQIEESEQKEVDPLQMILRGNFYENSAYR